MKHPLLIATLLLSAISPKAQTSTPQRSKAEFRKEFVASCIKEAEVPGNDTAWSRISKEYCNCAADKLLGKYTIEEIEQIGKAGKAKIELEQIIRSCMETLELQMKDHVPSHNTNLEIREIELKDPDSLKPGEVLETTPAPPAMTYTNKMPDPEFNVNQYLARTIVYPEKAIKKNIQGKVIVRFIVTADGSITDISIEKGLSPECDAEAIRAVSAMPKWKPGIQNGKAVPVHFTIPVTFKLEDPDPPAKKK